jgi:methyl-accepting chemotaxis protein
MKTANCALIADTSKFETPIERAKTKLVSFGATIKQVSSYAQVASGVFNKMVGFSEKINTIAGAFRNVADGVKSVQSIIQNMPSLFEKVKVTAQGAYDKIKSISPALAKIGVVAGVAGVAIFGVVKAVGALKGVGGGVFSSISSAIKNVGSVAGGVAGSIKNVFGGAVGALGGIVGLGAKAIGGLGVALGALDHFFKIGIMSAIELGDQYDVLSKRTGASIPFLYDFGKILKNNGMDASTAGTAILSLQRSLGGVNELGQPTNEMIKRLGLNFADLQKLTPEQQLIMVVGAIKKLGSETEQTRALFEMFGRAGMNLKAVMKDEAFSKLGVNFSKTGENLAKNAENFAKISAQLRDSGAFFRDFFVTLAGSVAPSILELFAMFSKGGDFLSDFGTKVGAQLKFAIDVFIGAFKSGSILSTMNSVFEIATITFKSLLSRAFQYGSNVFGAIMNSNIIPTIMSSLLDGLIGTAKALTGLLIKGFEEPLIYFKDVFDNIVQEIVVALSEGLVNAIIPFGGILSALGVDFAKMMDVRGGLEKTGLLLSPENIHEKNTQNISKMGAPLAMEGLDQAGNAFKALAPAITQTIDIITKSLGSFGDMSEEDSKKIQELTNHLKFQAEMAETSGKAIAEASGTAQLGAKEGSAKSAMSGAAVSSLQRIGGGGGAFAGDPLANAMTKQTKATEENTKAIKDRQTMFQPQPSNMTSNFLMAGTTKFE